MFKSQHRNSERDMFLKGLSARTHFERGLFSRLALGPRQKKTTSFFAWPVENKGDPQKKQKRRNEKRGELLLGSQFWVQQSVPFSWVHVGLSPSGTGRSSAPSTNQRPPQPAGCRDSCRPPTCAKQTKTRARRDTSLGVEALDLVVLTKTSVQPAVHPCLAAFGPCKNKAAANRPFHDTASSPYQSGAARGAIRPRGQRQSNIGGLSPNGTNLPAEETPI